MARVYIGLGSNIGNRKAHILGAIQALGTTFELLKASSIIETDPVGIEDQPRFLNAVVEVSAADSPEQVMRDLLKLESDLGRVRKGSRNGPRVIDLDLLAYDEESVSSENLDIPHPRMHERLFVLVPFMELNPNWRHPSKNLTVRELCEKLTSS